MLTIVLLLAITRPPEPLGGFEGPGIVEAPAPIILLISVDGTTVELPAEQEP